MKTNLAIKEIKAGKLELSFGVRLHFYNLGGIDAKEFRQLAQEDLISLVKGAMPDSHSIPLDRVRFDHRETCETDGKVWWVDWQVRFT